MCACFHRNDLLIRYRTLKRNYQWDLEDELLSCEAAKAAAVVGGLVAK